MGRVPESTGYTKVIKSEFQRVELLHTSPKFVQ